MNELKWLKQRSEVESFLGKTRIQFWEDVERGNDLDNYDLVMMGKNDELWNPGVKLVELHSLIMQGFKIEDYSYVPSALTSVQFTRCELGPGIYQYMTESSSNSYDQDAEFSDCKIPLDEMLQLVDYRPDFGWPFFYSIGRSSHAVISKNTGKLVATIHGDRSEMHEFDSVFELQEWLMNAPFAAMFT